MAINGVNRNPLELLISQDKNIQDFVSTIKAGDTLKGRVLEIIQGENKAIINFRGFNIISELPAGMQINQGDIINVQVSQVNGQVFMKLVPSALDLGSGAQMPGMQDVTNQQIIGMLNNIKVPVNEQNIFIAQKLVDYHLTINAENINDVSSALAGYMENKGIDVRAFDVQSPQAAKEIILENMLNLNAQLNQATAIKDSVLTLETPANIAAADKTQTVKEALQENAGNSKAVVNQNANVNVNVKSSGLAASQAVNIENLSAAQVAIRGKINNILNTIAAVVSGNEDVTITENSGTITLTIKNPQPNLLRNMAVSALRDGSITAVEADAVINNLNLSQPAVISAGAVVINKAAGNLIEIKFNNIRAMIEEVAAPNASDQTSVAQAVNNIKDSFNVKLLSLNSENLNSVPIQVKQGLMEALSSELKPVLQSLRDNTALLYKSITSPGDTNMEQNIKDIAVQISGISSSVSEILRSFDSATAKSTSSSQELAGYKTELNNISRQAQDITNKVMLPNEPEQINIAPKDFMAFQAIVKQFSLGLETIPVLNASNAADKSNDIKSLAIPAQVNPVIDMESTIEAIAFLKSRNLPAGNDGFIDIMGKYFKNDMKLNQNMEALNLSFDKFDAVKNTASVDRQTNVFINKITNLTSNIREIMQNISLNPSDKNLKLQVMQDQLLNFIDKSGLNTETKLKESLTNTAMQNTTFAASRETLKAQLINLSNELESSESLKLNSHQKAALNNVMEKSSDILTNMNALQFINQKPVSYEALYTQIPVLLNNKFFNGELQVWFRKGSLKENYEKSLPINFVFMLNTSNMGNVKISMTVYKKDVECNVSIDNEKAKQVLTREKNEFLKSMGNVNFNIKNFNIMLEKDKPVDSPALSDGYVNLGRINMQA